MLPSWNNLITHCRINPNPYQLLPLKEAQGTQKQPQDSLTDAPGNQPDPTRTRLLTITWTFKSTNYSHDESCSIDFISVACQVARTTTGGRWLGFAIPNYSSLPHNLPVSRNRCRLHTREILQLHLGLIMWDSASRNCIREDAHEKPAKTMWPKKKASVVQWLHNVRHVEANLFTGSRNHMKFSATHSECNRPYRVNSFKK